MSEGTSVATGDVEEAASEPRLELQIKKTRRGQVKASFWLRWGLSPALRDLIKELKYRDLHLLVSVYRMRFNDSDQARLSDREWVESHLVPLGKRRLRLRVSRAGHYRICVVVIGNGRVSYVRRGLVERSFFGSWLDGKIEFMAPDWRLDHVEESVATVSAEIGPQAFPRPPRSGTRWLLGKFYAVQLRDQTYNRGHVLLSVLRGLLELVCVTPLRVLVLLIALLLWRREIVWSGLRPFNFDSYTWGTKRSMYYADKHGRTRKGYWIPLWFTNPPMYLVASLFVSACIWRANEGRWTYVRSLGAASLWTAVAFVGLAILVWLGIFFGRRLKRMADSRKLTVKERRMQHAARKRTTKERRLDRTLGRATLREDGTLRHGRLAFVWLLWHVPREYFGRRFRRED